MKIDRLYEIASELEDIRSREAVRLWRLARRAAAHGCSESLVSEIREEGWKVWRIDVGDLLDPFIEWRWAFKGVI